MKDATPVELITDWLNADYKNRTNGKFKVVGYRSDMSDVVNWINYCMSWKPIAISEFYGMCGKAMNGDAPWPKGNLTKEQMLDRLPIEFAMVRGAIEKYS